MILQKNLIQLSISKTEMNTILAEAMKDEVAGAAIKRILNPFLSEAFPQFPEHTNVVLSTTDDLGFTVATLKVPVKRGTATVTDEVNVEPETEIGATDEVVKDEGTTTEDVADTDFE